MGRPQRSPSLVCGPYRLPLAERPLIMGVLNLTSDSFSDGNEIKTPMAALKRAKAMLAEGADILDLGAESTRPGATPVAPRDEIKRLLPVLKKLKTLSVPISVDTCKPEVAQAALAAGAHLVNDITGLRDKAMQTVVAAYKVPVVIMHMQGLPQTMQQKPHYRDVISEVRRSLLQAAHQAEARGIAREKIILDPGIGFGKTTEHNLQLLQGLQQLVKTGYPVLVGPSRKSFIADVLGPLPPKARIWGTAAAVAVAVGQGVQIIRVHDVKEMKMVAQVTAAICSTEFAGRRKPRV